MALSLLAPSDVGAAARDKINAGLSATVANATAIAAEGQARGQVEDKLAYAIAAEGQARGSVEDKLAAAIQSERQDRLAGNDALAQADSAEASSRLSGDQDTFAAALVAITGASQPGVSPLAFTQGLIGRLADLLPVDPRNVIDTALGPAWRLDGAGQIAPRPVVAWDPDAIWLLQVRYWRVTDVLDPNNNAVDLCLQWLDQSGAEAGTTLLYREANLRAQDGPQMRTFRVPSVAGTRPVIAVPTGAVSWRPYLRTYGSDGATAVSLLGARDITFVGLYAPDLADFAARIGRIEGQLAAGLPLTAPILPSYAIADLPIPGNRGRKAFAIDGRAPNAAGELEVANAGTGVEVTDNGTAWVITGTNQQVQA